MPSDMIKAGKGSFIAMSSSWGKYPSRGLAPYCATKFAIEGLMGCMAMDLKATGSPVTAIALDPGGGINTDMLADCLPNEHTEYRSAKEWGPGAVRYIEELVAQGKSGSYEIPDNVHSCCE